MPRDLSPVLPESVRVVFRTRRCSGSVIDTVPDFYVKTVAIGDITFTRDDLPAELTGTPGAIHTVHSEALALFNAGGVDPTNKTALDSLATQIAQDFYDFRSVGFRRSYNGIIVPAPSGLIDTITWTYSAIPHNDGAGYGDAEPITGGCLTAIESAPWNGEPEELSHLDPAQGECTEANNLIFGLPVAVGQTPCLEYFGPMAKCGGGGGAATATISDGQITGYTVTAAGTYTDTPIVRISGDGTGAAATATVSGGALASITPTAVGSGYTQAIVSFEGGGAKPQVTRFRLCLEGGRLVSRFVSVDTIM